MSIRQAGKSCMVVAAVLGIFLSLGELAGVASADLITFNFEGRVTSTNSDMITFGDKLVGSYSFQSDAPNLSPFPTDTGDYKIDHLSFTITNGVVDYGPYRSFTTALSPFIFTDGRSDGRFQRYDVGSHAMDGPAVYQTYSTDPFYPDRFTLEITGSDILENHSPALPLTPPSIGNLLSDQRLFLLEFTTPNRSLAVGVTGELTSLTLAPVPLPGAVLLFGAGLIGLGTFARIRQAGHF